MTRMCGGVCVWEDGAERQTETERPGPGFPHRALCGSLPAQPGVHPLGVLSKLCDMELFAFVVFFGLCMYVCMWVSLHVEVKVDIWCLPQSLSSFYIEAESRL